MTSPTRNDRIRNLGYDYASQPKSWQGNCNLCGSARWTILTHRDRYGYPATSTFCDDCGAVVLNPVMTPAAYGEFYRSVYRPLVSAYHGRLIDAKTVQADQWPYAREMESVLRPFLAGHVSPRFLDIGGSTGVVAAHFARAFGARATVIDPAPAEIDEARALGVETVTALVEDWHPGERQFDLIGLFQTIDHLLDVRGTLEKVRTLLAPRGIFAVDIVDFRHACLRNRSVEAAVKIDHPFNLAQDPAEYILRSTGFQVLRKSVSSDHLHVTFVCGAAEPARDARPDTARTREFFRELRAVQAGCQA